MQLSQPQQGQAYLYYDLKRGAVPHPHFSAIIDSLLWCNLTAIILGGSEASHDPPVAALSATHGFI